MIVITVARKPIVGTIAQNTAVFGTGGLNIDGARLDGPKGWPDSRLYTPHGMAGGVGTGPIYQDSSNDLNRGKGRWPSNFILQHASGCQYQGMQVVRIQGGSRPVTVKTQADGAIQFSVKPVGYQKIGYASDGQEEVESWVCVSGCPIRDLDQQSGVTSSQVRVGDGEPLDPSQEDWRFRRATGGFDDVGGASRFFKKVRSER